MNFRNDLIFLLIEKENKNKNSFQIARKKTIFDRIHERNSNVLIQPAYKISKCLKAFNIVQCTMIPERYKKTNNAYVTELFERNLYNLNKTLEIQFMSTMRFCIFKYM